MNEFIRVPEKVLLFYFIKYNHSYSILMEKEVLNKDWNENEIYTVFGRLNKGLLSNDEGIFKTISYGSFKRQYEGVEGYFNLKYDHNIKLWVIFQCVEVE